MIIRNPSRKTSYFDIQTLKFVDNWEEIINVDVLRSASLENHLSNCRNLADFPHNYKPVIKSIFPIPPRSTWKFSGDRFHPIDSFVRLSEKQASQADLEGMTTKIMSALNQNKIMVQLSGGLDTSIIIGMLVSLGYQPILFASVSERFEFRTERKIQQIFMQSSQLETIVVNEDNYLPFVGLRSTPMHFLPNRASLFSAGHRCTLEHAKKAGATMILNGMGGDALLCPEFKSKENRIKTDFWDLDIDWPNEFIYRPAGCNFLNPFALKCFARFILRRRADARADPKKLWARNYFSQYLPRELTQFAYKANFDAVYVNGLSQAFSEIENISKVAYEVTRFEELSPTNIRAEMNKFAHSWDCCDERLVGLLTFASWINSCVTVKRNDAIVMHESSQLSHSKVKEQL